MKGKIFAVLLFVVLINVSLIFVVQPQPQGLSKGGSSAQSWDIYLGKASTPQASKGTIATGVVSESISKKYAIIIGIADYKGTANDLDYSDDDAQDFNNVLLNKYDWANNQITLLIDGEATKTAILEAIDDVTKKAEETDEVIFFYSGHGGRSKQDIDYDEEKRDECIVTWEGSFDSLIWDGELKEAFEDCLSKRIMFYFDCCYSGGMTDLAGEGRLICMACRENQISVETSPWENWENGQFTYYFVEEGMSTDKADVNNDGMVTFEEAFDYAKANCLRQTPTANDNFTYDMLP